MADVSIVDVNAVVEAVVVGVVVVGVHGFVQFWVIGLQDFPSKNWLGGQLHPST